MFANSEIRYKWYVYIRFYLLLFLNTNLFCTAIEVCKLDSQEEGHCIAISKCNEALEDLKQNKKPLTCGFQNKEPMVCCEKISSDGIRPVGKISKESKYKENC